MTSTRRLLLAFLTLFALLAAACGDSDDASDAADDTTAPAETTEAAGDTKAAFVMVAPIGDAGWNFMHNEGRLGAEAATGVETAFVDSIPEGGAEFDNAVQDFIDQGFNVIITTSFGYMDATERFAAELEPQNKALQERRLTVAQARTDKRSTVPERMGIEPLAHIAGHATFQACVQSAIVLCWGGRAEFYFKNINGQIIDQFTVMKGY